MGRYSEEQAEQLRKQRVAQILEAALSVFADKGIQGTKMSMIAKEAGVSHGLMYHYFDSKETLLNESIKWATSGTEEFLEEVHQLAGSPLDKIRLFTNRALSFGNQDIFRLIQRFYGNEEIDKAIYQMVEDTGSKYIQFLIPIFIEGQEKGEIIQAEPMKLVSLYLTIISGILSDDIEWFQQDLDWNISIVLRMIQA